MTEAKNGAEKDKRSELRKKSDEVKSWVDLGQLVVGATAKNDVTTAISTAAEVGEAGVDVYVGYQEGGLGTALGALCEGIASAFGIKNTDQQIPFLDDMATTAKSAATLMSMSGLDKSPKGVALKEAIGLVAGIADCINAFIPARTPRWNKIVARSARTAGLTASSKAAGFVLEDNACLIAGYNKDVPILLGAIALNASGDGHIFGEEAEAKNTNAGINSKKTNNRQLFQKSSDKDYYKPGSALRALRQARWDYSFELAAIMSTVDGGAHVLASVNSGE